MSGILEATRRLPIAVSCTVHVPSGSSDGRVWNIHIVADQGRLLGCYRKLHLYDAFSGLESDNVCPGSEVPPLVEVDGWKLGLMTCYDVRFPELARRLALDGADALLLPAAWVRGSLKESHWEIMARARALENTVYVAAQCGESAEIAAVIFQLRERTGKHVDHMQLLGLVAESCVGVLGMDVNQFRSDGRKGGERHRSVVDVYLAAPLGGYLAADGHFITRAGSGRIVIFHPLYTTLLEQAPHLGVHILERGLDAAFTTGHHTRVGATAGQQRQRAEHDAFARTRLARYHGHAGTELNVHTLYQCVIPYSKPPEHRSFILSLFLGILYLVQPLRLRGIDGLKHVINLLPLCFGRLAVHIHQLVQFRVAENT